MSRYNWERPPTFLERHGKALVNLAIIATGGAIVATVFLA